MVLGGICGSGEDFWGWWGVVGLVGICQSGQYLSDWGDLSAGNDLLAWGEFVALVRCREMSCKLQVDPSIDDMFYIVSESCFNRTLEPPNLENCNSLFGKCYLYLRKTIRTLLHVFVVVCRISVFLC